MFKWVSTVAVLGAGLALGAGPTQASAPPGDDDLVAEFTAWGETEFGLTVQFPACDAGGSVCYGLVGEGDDALSNLVVRVTAGDGSSHVVYQPVPGQEEPGGAPTGSFGPGTQLVGTDIQPGVYRAVIPEGSVMTLCSWKRLSGLSGDSSDTITIDVATDPGAQVVVEIMATDVAFESSGCGEWQPVD